VDSVSDTVTSQGVVIAVDEPKCTWPEVPGSVLLVLDGIRDPGNVGTILRSAAACGQVRAVCAIDCADVWGTKAVRAGMGAHFRLSIFPAVSVDDIRAHANDRQWLVADSGGGVLYESLDWRRDCVLVIGGEAEGASLEARALADLRVTIPMASGSESLNAAVAASVLLFEAARQRRQ
jgi:RNA methyltransferase, TrmH family